MSAAEADILRRARARISDPARWCRGAVARNTNGEVTGANSPDAVAWCAVGAVYAVSDEFPVDPMVYVHAASNAIAGSAPGPYSDRGHVYALRLLDRAIELAEADQ